MLRLDEKARNAIRAGVIQNFEFTYELCWKFMQRWIRLNSSPADADPVTRKDLFRQAARLALIASPERWFDYAECRNITSHTYNEEDAERVFQAAERFIHDAQALLSRLEVAND